MFVHGWSGDKTSYGKVPELLKANGYGVTELHLGEYTTGDDDLSIDDYAIAMEKAVNATPTVIGTPFDVVIHSTGALVVRAWLTRFYEAGKPSPVKKLIMAAPANNGSLLAGLGKKLPWDWGNKLLEALELGSPFTWNLNWEWLNKPEYSQMPELELYHLQGIRNDFDFPGFLDAIDDFFGINIPVFEEDGSDNTVRFCASNLNVKGVKLAVGQGFKDGVVREINHIPTYVFKQRSHFGKEHGILAAITNQRDEVFQLILTLLGDGPRPPASSVDSYPKYAMLNVRVVDQLGNPCPDFIARFYFGQPDEKDAIDIKHRYENNEIDCYYLNIKELERISRFGFRIEPNRIRNALYAASEKIDIYYPAEGINFLEIGKTHFIEVVIEKSLHENAFKFIKPK